MTNSNPSTLPRRQGNPRRATQALLAGCLALVCAVSFASCTRSANSAPAASPTAVADASAESGAISDSDVVVAESARRPALAGMGKCAKAPVEAPICGPVDVVVNPSGNSLGDRY